MRKSGIASSEDRPLEDSVANVDMDMPANAVRLADRYNRRGRLGSTPLCPLDDDPVPYDIIDTFDTLVPDELPNVDGAPEMMLCACCRCVARMNLDGYCAET